MSKVIDEVIEEQKRQYEKWGEQNHDPFKYLSILVEEVGEVAKAILEHDTEMIGIELIQTAAIAVSFVECLDRKGEDK